MESPFQSEMVCIIFKHSNCQMNSTPKLVKCGAPREQIQDLYFFYYILIVVTAPLLCCFVFAFFLHCFPGFQLLRVYLLFRLIPSIIFSYVIFHSFVFTLFICCFYCLVQLLLPLVFQLPLSLRFRRRSRYTRLVNFRHFFPLLFVFSFGSLLGILSFLCAFVFS